MFVVAALFALTPRLHKRNHYFGSLYNLIIWLYYGISLFLAFGANSGFHFFFLGGATGAIVIFSVSRNFVSMTSFVVQTSLFLIAQIFFKEPYSGMQLSEAFVSGMLIINVMVLLVTIFCLVSYAFWLTHLAEDKLEKEYRYSERLLASIMPQAVASELKQNPEKTIAVAHDEVSIMFADIVGFTKRASELPAQEVVKLLNYLFSSFDKLAEKYQLEKVKTLGDSFMAAGNMPTPQADHAERICNMALDMLDTVKNMPRDLGPVDLRIGLHLGPAVAGVIGTKKPAYDVWGDTVNIASRLENSADVNHIQVCDSTKTKLEGKFTFQKRGPIDLKGRGTVNAWYLIGRA